jgi:hypothetical protein
MLPPAFFVVTLCISLSIQPLWSLGTMSSFLPSISDLSSGYTVPCMCIWWSFLGHHCVLVVGGGLVFLSSLLSLLLLWFNQRCWVSIQWIHVSVNFLFRCRLYNSTSCFLWPQIFWSASTDMSHLLLGLQCHVFSLWGREKVGEGRK